MIHVEDWAEIRRLHRAEQMPIRAIARHLGISKNTVKRALAHDRPPKYERPAKGSAVDAVEVQIRELLRETPTMPATVIAAISWSTRPAAVICCVAHRLRRTSSGTSVPFSASSRAASPSAEIVQAASTTTSCRRKNFRAAEPRSGLPVR